MRLLYNAKLDLRRLRIIGCTVFIHVPKPMDAKLSYAFLRTVLFGYDTQTKGYCYFNPLTRKIIINSNVNYFRLFLPAMTCLCLLSTS